MNTPDGRPMATLDPPASRALLQDAVVVGLTALIPVPLVDDLAGSAMRRRLLRAVLAAEGASLEEPALEALANAPGRGCLLGCPLAVVAYPLKRLFRKVFFFLEIKRSIDLASTSWHFGWLVQGLLRDGYGVPNDPVAAAALRTAITATLAEVGVKPVERAFRGVLRGSSGILRAAGARLGRTVLRTDRSPQHVEAAVVSLEAEEQATLGRLADQLLRAIDALPSEHFDRLRGVLRQRITAA